MNKYILEPDLAGMMTTGRGLCVSLVIPTHRTSPARRSDEFTAGKIIEFAKKELCGKYRTRGGEALAARVQELAEKIDFVHSSEGIGIFVSKNHARLVSFPFPVKKKLVIGDSFEVRDLVYRENFMADYYVLSLSEKIVRLFKGNGPSLREIKDGTFPARYRDTYEYSRPARGSSVSSSLKGAEKDKSVVEEKRLQAFFHELDKKLSAYINSAVPMLLAGARKDNGYFMKVSVHGKSIIGKVEGNFNHGSTQTLADAAWVRMLGFLKKKASSAVEEIREQDNGRKVSSGISNVWNAATQGRGLSLVVEKNFTRPAFLGEDGFTLLMHPPRGKHKVLADAVDDIIEIVLSKNGTVKFVDDGALAGHEGIALINRY